MFVSLSPRRVVSVNVLLVVLLTVTDVEVTVTVVKVLLVDSVGPIRGKGWETISSQYHPKIWLVYG